MLVGIDVGGTFTDAVIVKDRQVLVQTKVPTTHGNLLSGILAVLDQVLEGMDRRAIERISLSTTIVTNALIENKTDQVGLVLIPGPGLDIAGYVPQEPVILTGYTDHRGRKRLALAESELVEAAQKLASYKVLAVSGKFAVRNPEQEMLAAGTLRKANHPRHISLGAGMAGTLNFLRRTNSAYYNAAVWRVFREFAQAVEAALLQREITAPVYILKADGGTLPLAAAKELPVESIFTGPAASVLGIMALAAPEVPAVSLDIGGTTTDIALWQEGRPLFASRGAAVAGYPTAVRGFRLSSVGIGGDSLVRRENGELKIGPMRQGAPMALGGPAPTVSDALVVAQKVQLGNTGQAQAAMQQVAVAGQTPAAAAEEVLTATAGCICQAIKRMLAEQAAEPVYRVADIVHGELFTPRLLIGVGGAAGGLVPLVADSLGLECHIPDGAQVANAIGAAVARPTLDITFRADTEQGYYTVAEMGERGSLTVKPFGMSEARRLAEKSLAERAAQAGVDLADSEAVYAEEFNMVRGFHAAGKLITLRMQIKPGVLSTIDGISDRR